MKVGVRTLKILAGLVWYGGALALSLKASSLLVEALALTPNQGWTWLGMGTGLALGILQARFLFAGNCRKNLARIDTLEEPRLWQFFRPGFFLALAAMIATGATLSRLAHGNYPFLIGVAALDLSIGSALLISSYVFWVRQET